MIAYSPCQSRCHRQPLAVPGAAASIHAVAASGERTAPHLGQRGPASARNEPPPHRTLVACGRYDSPPVGEDLPVFGVQFEGGPDRASLGLSQLCVMVPLVYEEGLAEVLAAGEFTVFEGARVVGHGRPLAQDES